MRGLQTICHAPRERVSWNRISFAFMIPLSKSHAPRERVSWNHFGIVCNLHEFGHAPRERVSWNSCFHFCNWKTTRHAPRERVSWNPYYPPQDKEGEKSRSTWACELKSVLLVETSQTTHVTLHVSVWVEIFCSFLSAPCQDRHAPRERVSWNLWGLTKICVLWVTLHVSVWVEMHFWFHKIKIVASRSTWACELKSLYSFRSSATCFVTLHVSVWVEIRRHFLQNFLTKVTLHVSVWVEIPTIHRRIRRGKSHAPRERVSWNDIFACHQSPF